MTSDWFFGSDRSSLRLLVVDAVTGTNPETHTALPPFDLWRVACLNPEELRSLEFFRLQDGLEYSVVGRAAPTARLPAKRLSVDTRMMQGSYD